MAAVSTLIAAALREIGVLAAGETMGAADGDDALDTLNRLLDTWALENLTIYTQTRTTWTIVASTQNYTLGTGATINVARPIFIDHINFVDTSTNPNTEYPMARLTEDAWAGVRLKDLTAVFPQSYYYNATYATGLVTLWPIPTSTTLTGALYAPAAVPQFAALTTAVSLPPGYERMIVKNLAMELLPGYARDPNQMLAEQAKEAKSNVKRANKQLMDMSLDNAATIGVPRGGGYWIYSG